MAWPFDEVLLVRHGRTEWNEARRRQGRLDSALTDQGRTDTDRVAAALGGRAIDAIFTSPLGRCVATADRLSRQLGLTVVMIDELAEVDHGAYAGFTDGEIESRYPGELARRAEDKFRWRFPDGESYADAADRTAVALDRLVAAESRRPLLVAHEMIARMLMMRLLALSPEAALGLGLPHGAITIVHLTDRRIEVIPRRDR